MLEEINHYAKPVVLPVLLNDLWDCVVYRGKLACDIEFLVLVLTLFQTLTLSVDFHPRAHLPQGASGAGKSTFLDLLADRKREGVCSGEVRFEKELRRSQQDQGEDVDGRRGSGRKGSAERPMVYVTQDDYHIAELTVRETLDFAASVGMRGEVW